MSVNGRVKLTWQMFLWGYILPMALLIAGLFGSLYEIEKQSARESDIRAERVELAARTDRLICRRLNAERDILADLIRNVIAGNEDSRNRQSTATFFADALERLKPDNCNALPSSMETE